MNITVIGAGNMGAAFVKQLTRAGHKVAVTARNLDKAQAVAASNPGASAVVIGNAAAQADAVGSEYGSARARIGGGNGLSLVQVASGRRPCARRG